MARERRADPRSQQGRWWHTSQDLWGDLYHGLLTMSWPRFMVAVGIVFLVINALFALAYSIDPHAIVHGRPGSFFDAFFFSVQTMATIGYGIMYPGTLYANILMTLETLIGLFGLAIATGLAFSRFSRPRARILFSRYAVVCRYHGVNTLMFRAANQRGNQILEARIQVALLREERSPEGHLMRRFHDLRLTRQHTPIFSLSWTIMHPIDEASPLFGADTRSLQESDAQLVVILAGLDETQARTIHARKTYMPDDIQWGRRLRDVLSRTDSGQRVIDYSLFDEVTDE